MPADCEIPVPGGDSCGVLAVGRCGGCARAFCVSHRALDSSAAYVDLCGPCLSARRVDAEAARVAQLERGQAAKSAVTKAVQVLVTKGTPAPAEIMQPAQVKKLFGGYRDVLRGCGLYGWDVGRFDWEWWTKTHPKHDSELLRGEADTVVLQDGRLMFRDFHTGIGWVLGEGNNAKLADRTASMEKIAARLRAVAATGS